MDQNSRLCSDFLCYRFVQYVICSVERCASV